MFKLNQINDISLMDLLFGKRTVKKSIQTKPYTMGRRDVLEISSAVKNMQKMRELPYILTYLLKGLKQCSLPAGAVTTQSN